MGNTAHSRLQLAVLACVLSALVSACGGSDSSDGTAATPVANDGGSNTTPVENTSSDYRQARALGPWGFYRTGSSTASQSGSESGSASASSSSSSSSSSAGSSASGSSSPPGTATLSWQAPTENTDGTPLTNLAGYYIDYGSQSQTYTTTIQITNPSLTSYVVENLAPGTYYFVVTAYNSTGQDSGDSNQASVTVQ